jgi:hypothetical protein
MNLSNLKAAFVGAGCTRLYAKVLAENDNSKNQIYFAGAVEALNIFPSNEITAENTKSSGPTFKARLNFGWLQENGMVACAPKAQLILYSQYPEVRFSGFLDGCRNGPSKLMADRRRAQTFTQSERDQLIGRVLFMGVTDDRQVIGYVAAGKSQVAEEFSSRNFPSAVVVFREIDLPRINTNEEARIKLLSELKRIHDLGWIDSKQLDAGGVLKPCHAPQCGGFTLEAELGIAKNSLGEPDYLGWEVKQHAVPSIRSLGTAITLMTPEPNSGYYKEQGVEAFIRKFGYPDKNNKPDRLNFGGIHRVGRQHASTGLTMQLIGYDITRGKIIDANGSIALIDHSGAVAAAWGFGGLLAHWSRKHTRAVYVPSMRRKEPKWQYNFGSRVRLAQHTDSLRLLSAMASGIVYYDPGIKLEKASTKPEVKRRSQFRVASKNIDVLYETVETVEL